MNNVDDLLQIAKGEPLKDIIPRQCNECFYHLAWWQQGFPIETVKYPDFCGHPDIPEEIKDMGKATKCNLLRLMDNGLIKALNGETEEDVLKPTWWENSQIDEQR